jgi:GNAT superfamily N-acetyltransferase
MIIRASKASPDVLGKTTELVVEDQAYMKEAFPECANKIELLSALRNNHEEWNILYSNRPEALFTLQFSGGNAVIEKLRSPTSIVLDMLITNLQSDLRKSKIHYIIMRVPEQTADALSTMGFERQRMIVKLAGPVIGTNFMPILPLVSPTERDLPALAKLMHESYQRSAEPAISSVSTAEERLYRIMRGLRGAYDGEASLMSGAIQNIVSACFIVLSSHRQARVAEVFTHPLYRARGLATTEIATAMNRLLQHGVQTLTVQLSERNDVASRLFAKLGFKQVGTVIEMARNFQ